MSHRRTHKLVFRNLPSDTWNMCVESLIVYVSWIWQHLLQWPLDQASHCSLHSQKPNTTSCPSEPRSMSLQAQGIYLHLNSGQKFTDVEAAFPVRPVTGKMNLLFLFSQIAFIPSLLPKLLLVSLRLTQEDLNKRVRSRELCLQRCFEPMCSFSLFCFLCCCGGGDGGFLTIGPDYTGTLCGPGGPRTHRGTLASVPNARIKGPTLLLLT